MKKFSEMKSWEREYIKKRILRWSLIGGGICLILLVLLLLPRKRVISYSTTPSYCYLFSEIGAPKQFWDECTDQQFQIESMEGEEIRLTDHISLRAVSAKMDNGETTTQDMIVASVNGDLRVQDITSRQFFKGCLISYNRCVYVYCLGYSKEEIVICVVTQSHEVEDSLHSRMVQRYRDGFWYTYIPFNDKDHEGYKLIADGYNCTKTLFSRAGVLSEDVFFEYTEPLRANTAAQ